MLYYLPKIRTEKDGDYMNKPMVCPHCDGENLYCLNKADNGFKCLECGKQYWPALQIAGDVQCTHCGILASEFDLYDCSGHAQAPTHFVSVKN